MTKLASRLTMSPSQIVQKAPGKPPAVAANRRPRAARKRNADLPSPRTRCQPDVRLRAQFLLFFRAKTPERLRVPSSCGRVGEVAEKQMRQILPTQGGSNANFLAAHVGFVRCAGGAGCRFRSVDGGGDASEGRQISARDGRRLVEGRSDQGC